MIDALLEWKDRLLGRGDASITVPVFDGALKSNNLLEEAATFATLGSPEDLATDGRSLFVADGGTVLRYEPGVAPSPAQAGGSPTASIVYSGAPAVTALACLRDGGLALALDGRELRIVGGPHDGRRWDAVGGSRMNAVNATGVAPDGRLLVTDGSLEHPVAHWRHDLMSLGRSGRLFELHPASGEARVLASGLAYAFGACAAGTQTWVSESWSHRVRECEAVQALTDFTDEGARLIELEQPGLAAAGIHEHVALRVGRDADAFPEEHVRRQLEKVRHRIVGDLRDVLRRGFDLCEQGRACQQNCEDTARDAEFHAGDLACSAGNIQRRPRFCRPEILRSTRLLI